MEVSCASSFDARFDPANVLTQDNSSWTTTGLYPQEITISFAQAKVINEVRCSVAGARKIQIEGCQTATGNQFKQIGESKGKCSPLTLQSCPRGPRCAARA